MFLVSLVETHPPSLVLPFPPPYFPLLSTVDCYCMRRTLGTGSFSSYAILGNFIGGFKEGFTALDMVEKGCVSFLLTLVNIMYGPLFPLPQVYSTIIIVGYGVFKLKEVAVIDSSDATKKWSEEVARIRKTIRTQSFHVWILCEPSILSRMIIPEHVTLVLFSFSLQRSRYRQLQDDREGCTGMLSLCLCHIPRSLQLTRLSIQRRCTNEYPFLSLSLILKAFLHECTTLLLRMG